MKNKEWDGVYKGFKSMASLIHKMIFLEEKILYPTSVKKLDTRDWIIIKKGESEIGYAWVTPGNLWDANLAAALASAPKTGKPESGAAPMTDNRIKLEEGFLTAEQLNLMLKELPFDITFVDENDKVCYYTASDDRIFPRSPAIIGRAVQNCHPPKSVHIVENILKNFKEKKKDEASFWLHLGDKFVYIRYFPLYDAHGNYKGVIEVSQEISGVRSLEGERKLLDW
jgi:DUF438 domain-containing protein